MNNIKHYKVIQFKTIHLLCFCPINIIVCFFFLTISLFLSSPQNHTSSILPANSPNQISFSLSSSSLDLSLSNDHGLSLQTKKLCTLCVLINYNSDIQDHGIIDLNVLPGPILYPNQYLPNVIGIQFLLHSPILYVYDIQPVFY